MCVKRNDNLDLLNFDDPLPLAMVASRDPEPPMAMAAAARLSPRARRTELVTEVFDLLGEITKHSEVRHCVELVSANAFSPQAIAEVRRRTSRVIVHTRQQYTAALRQNMKDLMDGAVAPRQFVKEFFRLTEAGNLRNDIRKKLVLSLLLSDTIRPSIKFLFLENFDRFPNPVRMSIITSVLRAKPTHHVELIKEELKWIVAQERPYAQPH